jgi:hypothetical protein
MFWLSLGCLEPLALLFLEWLSFWRWFSLGYDPSLSHL